MITMRVLDIVDAIGIVPRLCARHREELLRSHGNLETWARGRVGLPGPQWAMDVDGQVMLIGGVVDEGDAGTLWIAGAAGWERYARQMLRIFREIRKHGGFARLQCQCYADNFAAQHLVERLGFERGEVRAGLVDYGMRMAP